eukprot:c32896_g1_i1 orf=172-1089(-)
MVASTQRMAWEQTSRLGKRVVMGNEDDLRMSRQEEEGRRRSLQIVFFDLETTVASGEGDKPKLLEFGAVVLAAQGLREIQAYSTLVRQPGVFSMGPKFNLARHRIVDLPSFNDIADHIFDMLHGRIWAGHNIIKFDMVCIRDAFASARRPSPEPAGVIDTLPLLRETFGPRAGDLKMASLARYCGLGRQKHRSLADVRMNVEVLKHCATMLFLESRYPSVLMLQKQSPTRSASRQLEGGGAILPTPTRGARWDQVILKPRFRTSIEMKRTSSLRPPSPPMSSSSSTMAMSRQPQAFVLSRAGPSS